MDSKNFFRENLWLTTVDFSHKWKWNILETSVIIISKFENYEH